MKYIFKTAVLALGLGLGFSACQKDYDATPTIKKDPTFNTQKGSFECQLGQFKFIADTKEAIRNTADGANSLTIIGTKYADNREEGVYEKVTLNIPNFTGNGKYNILNTANIVYTISDNTGFVNRYVSTPNENFFVDIQGEYKGTFNVVLSNVNDPNQKIIISDGIFDLE